MGSRARTVALVGGGLVGAGAAAAAGLAAQVWWAVSRPHPSFTDLDCSGIEGASGPTVVVKALGDSTLTGPGLDRPGDVWLRLAARTVAEELGVRLDCRILAVGGSRASDVLVDQVPFLEEEPPDIAVVAVGANDVLKGTSLRAFRREMLLVVEHLHRVAPEVLVAGIGDLGTIPRLLRPLSNVVTHGAQRVNAAIASVIAEVGEGAHFVDVAAADLVLADATAEVFSPDRFHVSAVGHAAWADCAVGPLREAVTAILATRESSGS